MRRRKRKIKDGLVGEKDGLHPRLPTHYMHACGRDRKINQMMTLQWSVNEGEE